jgi:monooxygenase
MVRDQDNALRDMQQPDSEHLDVLVVGAGLSGIDAAYHLGKRCSWARFAILEARETIGGTWDLFRYPGIRSDSDPHTLGFPFRPWPDDRSIADGPAILRYIEDTARAFGIDRHIRFGCRVVQAAWSSTEARWTVIYEEAGRRRTLTCAFLFMCAGYYDYAAGYEPVFPGRDEYKGLWIHPQHWPADLDHAGKRIAVIGSGATAVTLVPAMAETASHVTMIQRSPSYVVSRAARDGIAAKLFSILPQHAAAGLVRWKNIAIGSFTYWLSRRHPKLVRRSILKAALQAMPGVPDVDRHFSPAYAPWDQRVCLIPDGDLFIAIRDGRVEMITDDIQAVSPAGLKLASGREIAADIIVSATGLSVRLMGGIALIIDGVPAEPATRMVYKGMMIGGIPNLAFSIGYTNASWTLKCDLVSRYVCRLLNRMRRHGSAICMPQPPEQDVETRPLIDFSSGYIKRAEADMPKQGSKAPWRLRQNYAIDLMTLRFGRLEDGVMAFRAAGETTR